MKNKIIASILVIVMLFAFTGCGKKTTDNNSTSVDENNTNETNNTQPTGDSIPISQITGLYNNDLPLGLENNYLKVNGNDIVIRVQTFGS